MRAPQSRTTARVTAQRDEIAVIGAGLAGCLTACFLARRGYPVALYERRPDPRTGTVERGRSINLALSERGLDALRRIGLDEQVMTDALPMRGRMIHPVEGEPQFQSYSAAGDRAINSISRGALNNALLDAAAALPGVRIAFDHRLVGLDPTDGGLTFDTPQGTVTAERVGGAGRRRRRLRGARAAARARAADRERGLPRLRLQGADPAAAGRGLRAGPGGRAAHLAARHLDDDRAAQPGPLLHLHAVLAHPRHRELRLAGQPGGDRTALRRSTTRTWSRWRRTWSTTTSTTRSACSAPSAAPPGRSTGRSACSATRRTPSCRSTARAPTAPSRTWSSWTAASTSAPTTGRRRCRCSSGGGRRTPRPSRGWR